MTDLNANHNHNPALLAALRLSTYSIACFPCRPKSKQPATEHGFKDASADYMILRDLFEPQDNIGAALSAGYFVLDIDGPEGAQWASERELPRTWIVRTAKGRHYWFRSPAEVRSVKVAAEVETKGAGGYVLVPPSVHPSGVGYRWETGPDEMREGPAEAPSWLLELALPVPREHKPRERLNEADGRPGSAYSAQEGAIEELLERAGWEYVREDRDGRRAWKHPTATNGLSANVLPANGEAPELLHVFSSNAGFPDANETYNAFGVLAWLEHSGDYSAAARELAAQGYGQPSPSFFFDRGGFVPQRMGQQLNREGRIVLGEDSRLYRYVGGVYRADGREYAARRTRELLGEESRRRHWTETEGWLRQDMPAIGTEPNREWLNLPNGRLHWRSGELANHSPDYMDTIRIPVAWKPGARCPGIRKFLAEVLPEDCIEFVLELFGYLLIPDTRFQKAVMLLGPTGTGKGTLLHLMERFIGGRNTATITLHELSEDRFASSDLFGKLANILGDLDARSVERSDMFKMVTGQDRIRAQFKYGHAFTYVPFCRLVFSANEAPPTADQSDAYFGRWLIVPMGRQFRDTAEENTRLRDELTQPAELDGLMQLAIPALRRLMDRGRFAVPATVARANAEVREKLDSIRAWVGEHCILDADNWNARKRLYADYRQWCLTNGRKPLASTTVYDRLRGAQYPVEETVRHGVRGFQGIACFGSGPGDESADSPATKQDIARLEKRLAENRAEP